LLYRVTDLIAPLRVDEHHEQLGLDLSQHGESISVTSRRHEDYTDNADYVDGLLAERKPVT
jgi:hypothetical protein